MYLNIMNNKKTGNTTLSIRRGYRDTNGKVKNVTVQYLGKLDDLKKEFDDPISHFKNVVAQMNEEEKVNNKPIILKIDKTFFKEALQTINPNSFKALTYRDCSYDKNKKTKQSMKKNFKVILNN